MPIDDNTPTTNPDAGDSGYEVGYGKPPKAHRFKPGQSGNPRGRKKGTKSFSTLVQEELDSKIVVVTDGARRKMTKREIVAKKLVARAMQGDIKVAKELLGLDGTLADDVVHEAERQGLSAGEQRLLAQHLAFLNTRKEPGHEQP